MSMQTSDQNEQEPLNTLSKEPEQLSNPSKSNPPSNPSNEPITHVENNESPRKALSVIQEEPVELTTPPPMVPKKEIVTVKDTFSLVFIIALIQGIGVLMPWNMFLNISYDYYESYKLRDVDANGTSVETTYSKNFQSAMTIASQVPSLLINLANLLYSTKGDLTRRITIAQSIIAIVTLITISLVFVETVKWLGGFFVLTLVSIIALNAANGVYQNSMFGLLGTFPFKYVNGLIIGQNFCGTFVTVLAIATKAVSDNVKIRATLYFSLALLTIIVCILLVHILRKIPFYRYYSTDVVDSASASQELTSLAENGQAEDRPLAGNDRSDMEDKSKFAVYWEVLKEAKIQFFNIFFLFFVTLSMFPNITMYVQDAPLGKAYNFILPEKYFMDIVIFLNFNLFAFLGSTIANWVQPGPKYLWIAVVVRIWFMLYFPLCNYMPANRRDFLPVVFTSTWLFALNLCVLALTSGYLSSIIMMYAPKSVHPSKARIAGMLAAFFLIFGIVCGLVFSVFVKFIVVA